jgi:tetratricopeptide (TPR) repeat protein
MLSGLTIGLVTLVMSIKSRRFIPLFGISQSLLLAPALAMGLSWLRLRIARSLPRLDRPRVWLLAPPVVAVIWGGLRLLPYPLSGNAFLYLTSLESFPVEAMNLVEANHLEGKVFSFYNWGGYIELRTEGRLQVFIDGRAGTVFDAKTYRQYQRVASLHHGWEDVVWDSGADFVLWPRRDPKQIEQLLKSDRWRPLYSDHVAALLLRADRTPPRPLLPTPDSPWRDLTLGWSAAHVHDYAEAEVHFRQALNRMPSLRPACEWLANAQAQTARLAEAEATLDRCQRMFPDSERRKQLLDLFKTRSGGLPP